MEEAEKPKSPGVLEAPDHPPASSSFANCEPHTTSESVKEPSSNRHIAVFCVGNRLMLDDGVGSAVYDELVAAYDFPDCVELYDVGCMTLDMTPYVERCDCLITVDALDGTETEPGTVLAFAPEDMARHAGATTSLHDLKLVDLFDAAALLGYHAQGCCLGMQIENASPAELAVGLTPRVYSALPLLVDAVLAELVKRGVQISAKATGELISAGWHHTVAESTQTDEPTLR